MHILLAGTGPAAGFPVPGCPCAICGSPPSAGFPARRPAELRLIDGTGPAWRLDIDGAVHGPGRDADPAVVIETIGAGDHPGRAGLLVRTGRHDPFLWAPQAGPLTDATLHTLADRLAGVPLSAVFLGPAPEADPDAPQDEQPPLVECALGLARLRAAGLVTARSRCLLVGTGHRPGAPDRLGTCLEYWAAQAPVDGSRVALPSPDRESTDRWSADPAAPDPGAPG